MPRRKTSNSEVSEPAVTEAVIKNKATDEAIVHDAHPTDVNALLEGKADDSEVDPDATEKYIMYVGRATERNIDSEDWPAGVDKNLSASWGFHNGFKILASSFTKSQLEYLLGDQDDGFKLVDGART